MILSLLTPQNPLLNQKSERVSLTDLRTGKYNDLIDSMFRFARGEQADREKKVLVGLAAPQIGHLVQIILVDLAADGKGKTGNLQVFINPEIIWESPEKSEWYEGCFSAGNIAGIVSRPNRIRVRALDRQNKQFEAEYPGYTGRIIQHECHHLEGVRFPDLISDPNNLHIVKPDQWVAYRNSEDWRNWPHKALFAAWEKMKRGN